MTESLRLKAPAKVNFRLDVLKKRSDGYHDLRMIMQRIDLCDDIELSLREEPGISLYSDHPFVPQDKRNIVWKAAEEMLGQTDRKVGLNIKLKKNIPVAAGLGGGSSDAASTLMGLNQLLGTGLTDNQLMTIGQRLGADVPFFIFKKPAVAEGIGEQLSPLQHIPKLWIALINPGIHVATSWVYQNLNLTSEKVAAKLPFLYKTTADVCAILSNDLEAVTLLRYPIISEIKNQLIAAGAHGSLMSGSGSTVFAIFDNELSAVDAIESGAFDKSWFKTVVMTI